MFTGIVEETGTVRAFHPSPAGAALLVDAVRIPRALKAGDSIAVNGVCVTVTDSTRRGFSCQLSAETLRRSALGKAREGTVVNLERPLALGDRLGGHIVQGHVDGVGRLASALPSGEGMEMEFSFPEELGRYLVTKGSVTVDGISLTVAVLKPRTFVVAVIPYTYEGTSFRHLTPGDEVNLEMDILAKYFERFFQLGLNREQNPGRILTLETLKEQGF
jgi:riboflavin synthase